MSNDPSDTALLIALLDAAVDAIVIADSAGQILRVNPAACQLFGHCAETMLGQSLDMLMPGAMANRHGGFIDRHLATGEARIIGLGRNLEGLRQDGSIFPLHLSVGRTETEGQVYFVGIMRDLTAQRAAEQALERSQRLEAVGQMTGGIAHDFNNLLTIITGNLELLEAGQSSETERALTKDALEAAELGADLTARLLTFARKSVLRPERLDLNARAARAIELMQSTLTAKQSLTANLAEELWEVIADPAQLQTALFNLIGNAQDAIRDEGAIVVETRNARIDDAYIAQETDIAIGDYVRISVSDTGDGMSSETKRRALEPFFTTKPGGKGTGLGLATVYGFVRQSGGHMTIYSEEGQGTTVSLYLPVAEGATETKGHLAATNEAAARRGAGETILIVEDEDAVRRLTLRRLESLGYLVLGAAHVDEALRVLSRNPQVDLVFTDLIMPGKRSGYDLALQLQKERPELPVLLTSGYAGEVMQTENIDHQEFALLRKPYRQKDLAQAIWAALHGRP